MADAGTVLKQEYEAAVKREKRQLEYESFMRKVGIYVTGREGMGKSTTLHVLSKVARIAGWNVVYLPDCRQWIDCAVSAALEL